MNGKIKAITIIVTSIVVCMLIYSPLSQATQSSVSLGGELTVATVEECKPANFRVGPRVRFAVWFLKHAELIEVEGTFVTMADKMLILSLGEDMIRVHLPANWSVDNDVLTREELFAGGYMSKGESVLVKALGADLIDKNGLRIYLLVGYKIISESGFQVTANLRVNIED